MKPTPDAIQAAIDLEARYGVRVDEMPRRQALDLIRDYFPNLWDVTVRNWREGTPIDQFMRRVVVKALARQEAESLALRKDGIHD